MGHRETLLPLRATLDQLPPNCSPITRASVRRSTASFKPVYGPRDDGSEALRPWLTAWRDGQSTRRKASYLVSQNRRGSRTLSYDTRNVRRNWARTHQSLSRMGLKRSIWSAQSAHLRGDAHHRLRTGL